MRKFASILFSIIAIVSLSACSSSPSKPRISAGASHSAPFTLGQSTPAWLTNSVRVYPWSKGRKVRVSTGVSVKPTRNTNAGVGIDW